MFDVGVDLAWKDRAPTGLAVVDPAGRLRAVTQVRTNAEILAWLQPWKRGAGQETDDDRSAGRGSCGLEGGVAGAGAGGVADVVDDPIGSPICRSPESGWGARSAPRPEKMTPSTVKAYATPV
jgi:hypothetical protein